MTYKVTFDPRARSQLAKYSKDDPGCANLILDAANALAHDPRPAGALRLGNDNNYRVHVGRYRLRYWIKEREIVVTIVDVGRVA